MIANISNKARSLAAATAAAGLVALGFAGTPAQADPSYTSPLVGVGSDTIQDLGNAFAGYSAGVSYTPLVTSAANGSKPFASFNALNPQTGAKGDCIATKLKGGSIERPDGSGNGQEALSRASLGESWGTGTTFNCGSKSVSSLIDFSRSSSGPASTTLDQLTFIPFGRDAVSYITYKNPASLLPAVTAFTQAELQQIYGNGQTGTYTPLVKGGLTIIPCGLQTGSGTHKFWVGTAALSPLGGAISTAEEDLATNGCTGPAGANRIQENSGDAINTVGNAYITANPSLVNVQFIAAHSAASYAAQFNGTAPSRLGTGTALGTVSGVSTSALDLVSGKLVPNTSFYASTSYGRDVYFVLDSAKVAAMGGGEYLDLQEMFVGSTSKVCSASSTIQDFGFQTSVPLVARPRSTGPYVPGTTN